MWTVGNEQTPGGVLANTFPYDPWHDRYQEYYQTGLKQYLQLCGQDFRLVHHTRFPTFLKSLRRVRDASRIRRILKGRVDPLTHYLDWVARHSGAQHSPSAPLVGEYSFSLNPSPSVKLCIDAHDSGTINSPSLLEKCDVYLKTNYWKGVDYHPRVRPFYVCNPTVLPHLAELRAMRDQHPVFDLSFIVRVWGGPTGVEGIEHCMRLLEAVAKVRANKFILAELMIGDTAAQARRLHRSGIPTTTSRIDLQRLWQVTARSRLNISRLGNHHCMSWRMTDLLALGACVVLDQHPKTLWPAPLVPKEHYYSLNTTTSNEDPVAADYTYAVVPEMLEELLSRHEALEDMRRHSAQYFDCHMHPIQIGRQIHDILVKSLPDLAGGTVVVRDAGVEQLALR